MIVLLKILAGLCAFVFLAWLLSEIQIKVWLKGIEKHLLDKFNNLKTETDEREKE